MKQNLNYQITNFLKNINFFSFHKVMNLKYKNNNNFDIKFRQENNLKHF